METDTGLIYLTVAYTAFFLLLAVYTGLLHRRLRQLHDAVQELEEGLERLRSEA